MEDRKLSEAEFAFEIGVKRMLWEERPNTLHVGPPGSSCWPEVIDLRSLPHGAAQLSLLRFLKHTASKFTHLTPRPDSPNSHPLTYGNASEDVLPAGITILTGDKEHAVRLKHLCQSVNPPLEMHPPRPRRGQRGASEERYLPNPPSECPSQGVLHSKPAALRRWAQQLVEQTEKKRRYAGFGIVVAAHNVAWTGALLVFLSFLAK